MLISVLFCVCGVSQWCDTQSCFCVCLCRWGWEIWTFLWDECSMILRARLPSLWRPRWESGWEPPSWLLLCWLSYSYTGISYRLYSLLLILDMHWDRRSEKASESSAFFIILICYIILSLFSCFLYLLFTEIIIPMYICLILINWLIQKKLALFRWNILITLEFIVPK